MLPAYALPDAELLRACRVERFRSGGPGGQHANRTESAVRLTHEATVVVAACQDERSFERNQAAALRRLRIRLVARLRGQADPVWLAPHRSGRQVRMGAAAPSYPLVAAVGLDALAAADGSLSTAAETLAISGTQLARLLTADPDIRAAADAIRSTHGLTRLKA